MTSNGSLDREYTRHGSDSLNPKLIMSGASTKAFVQVLGIMVLACQSNRTGVIYPEAASPEVIALHEFVSAKVHFPTDPPSAVVNVPEGSSTRRLPETRDFGFLGTHVTVVHSDSLFGGEAMRSGVNYYDVRPILGWDGDSVRLKVEFS